MILNRDFALFYLYIQKLYRKKMYKFYGIEWKKKKTQYIFLIFFSRLKCSTICQSENQNPRCTSSFQWLVSMLAAGWALSQDSIHAISIRLDYTVCYHDTARYILIFSSTSKNLLQCRHTFLTRSDSHHYSSRKKSRKVSILTSDPIRTVPYCTHYTHDTDTVTFAVKLKCTPVGHN